MNQVNHAILYDAFNKYYDMAVEAKNNGEYAKAKKLFLLAADTKVKQAELSNGVYRDARLEAAENLVSVANSLPGDSRDDSKEPQVNLTKNLSNAKTPTNDTETIFHAAEIPNVTFDDVAGLHDVKAAIETRIIKPRLFPRVYEALNKKPGGGILMFGPPGTGKTLIARAIANKVGAAFFSIKCSEIVSKWFGEAERNVKNLFETARKHEVAIIFFDEFESLGTKRGGNSTVMNRLVPELLAQIDGFQGQHNTLMLIAATNRPWDIDSAFMRPGRFAEPLYISLPDKEARKHIIRKSFRDVPLEEGLDIDELADFMDGLIEDKRFNGADVVELCDRSKDPAADRCIEMDGDPSVLHVRKADIRMTAQKVKSSVQEADIIALDKFMKKYT
jgi:SpoVK/Ycf46/Vps4 family AAA+-type ATPase